MEYSVIFRLNGEITRQKLWTNLFLGVLEKKFQIIGSVEEEEVAQFLLCSEENKKT